MLAIPTNWRQPAVPAVKLILEALVRAGGSLSIPIAGEETDIEEIKLLMMLTAMAVDGDVEIISGDKRNTYTITDAGRAFLNAKPH
ncbi:hypothetical protein [Bradyrhizobium diazoefficiens]